MYPFDFQYFSIAQLVGILPTALSSLTDRK